MIAGLSRIAHDLAAFAFPVRCAGCGAPADEPATLCAACMARIPTVATALCVRCLVAGRDPSGCLRHPGFAAWPAWIYDERAESLVHALKFSGRDDLGPPLGAVMARAWPPKEPVDVVLAVPLHPARRRERGYNQSALLARGLAAALGAPFMEGAMMRSRATPPQTGLGHDERRRNAHGAFRLAEPGVWKERRVVLVDDVLTTGATLEAGLACLREAGARAAACVLAWAA